MSVHMRKKAPAESRGFLVEDVIPGRRGSIAPE